MANERLPVTPQLLRWARVRAGLDADELRAEFPHFDAWERGERCPTYPQLERLSEKLKVPIAVFFFPAPPDLPPIRQSFRTVPDAQFDALPRGLRFLLRKAAVLQLNLSELNDGGNPSGKFILNDLKFAEGVDIRRMAQTVRNYLSVSIEEQVGWQDTEAAFASWRNILERHGIAVFKDAFRDDDYAGFCLYDAVFPVIYVNNSVRTREIFTLFHELAHLLFHTSGIDILSDEIHAQASTFGRWLEIACNRFAAEFLLPSEYFDAEADEFGHEEAGVTLLSQRYNVSREVVLRRFLDRGEVTSEEYRRTVSAWAQRSGQESGGDYYWTKIAYLGTNYIDLAFSRYYQNRITEPELADYLDTKVKNLPKLEAYFQRKVV